MVLGLYKPRVLYNRLAVIHISFIMYMISTAKVVSLLNLPVQTSGSIFPLFIQVLSPLNGWQPPFLASKACGFRIFLRPDDDLPNTRSHHILAISGE